VSDQDAALSTQAVYSDDDDIRFIFTALDGRQPDKNQARALRSSPCIPAKSNIYECDP
jgi:hypothetical protein